MIPTVCLGFTSVLPPSILNNIHILGVQRVVLGNMQYLSQDKVLRYEDSSRFVIWMRNIEKRLEAILSTFRVSQWLVMVS